MHENRPPSCIRMASTSQVSLDSLSPAQLLELLSTASHDASRQAETELALSLLLSQVPKLSVPELVQLIILCNASNSVQQRDVEADLSQRLTAHGLSLLEHTPNAKLLQLVPLIQHTGLQQQVLSFLYSRRDTLAPVELLQIVALFMRPLNPTNEVQALMNTLYEQEMRRLLKEAERERMDAEEVVAIALPQGTCTNAQTTRHAQTPHAHQHNERKVLTLKCRLGCGR